MNWTKPWRWGLAAITAGTIVLAACDGDNLFDSDRQHGSGPDAGAPAITLTAPAPNTTVSLGDSVRVSFRVRDNNGVLSVRMVGQATRVDSLGPTTVVNRFAEKTITFTAPLPVDTVITRYLVANSDTVSELVDIIVSATDSAGNTSTEQQQIAVGGPRVELRSPLNNAPVVPGGTLQLSAFAVDRSTGIDSVRINISGAQTATFGFGPNCAAAECAPVGLPSADSVIVNPTYVVGPELGNVIITAVAYNRNRIAGTSAPITVRVNATAAADAQPPRVQQSITMRDRVELTDTISVDVAAVDDGAAGLRRMGVVVFATPAGLGMTPDTLYRDTIFPGTGRTGVQTVPFKFTLKDLGYNELNLIRLPRDFNIRVHAFAVDTVSNCGASVSNTLTALPCDSIVPPTAPRKFLIAAGSQGNTFTTSVVAGFARRLPTTGSRIADVVVDMTANRPRVYLSNQNFNRIDVLELDDSTFAAPVNVGSEPWGMFINNTNDRLIVANSGGTNLSFVNTNVPLNQSLNEMSAERVLTPNASLFDVRREITPSGVNYLITIHDFSDRPQFVAQDANGVILHSTKPTGAAPDGTVRYLEAAPAGAPRRYESKILFNDGATDQANDNWAIAHIDSIGDGITLYDHVPGYPGSVFSATDPDLDVAIAQLRALGSDIYVRRSARWNLEEVGLSDTTYVATSTDGQFIAFGEGAVAPFASIWLWHCAPLTAACNEAGTSPGPGKLSDEIEVDDLIGNAADRVVGLALDKNGRLGAARGGQSAYFFSNDVANEGELRLQGLFSQGVAGGNGGIALHPNHVYSSGALSTPESNDSTLAFVATGNRSIKIVDTFHFRDRGEIQIRDNIVGPLRAALPLAAENPLGTPECDQIWVKLYGVTSAGNAVIVNVRKKDVINPIITSAACPL